MPSYKPFLAFMLPFLLIGTRAMAQGSSTGPGSFQLNLVLIGLVGLALILLFAILILANIVRQLSHVYRDRMRAHKNKAGTIAAKALVVLITIGLSFSPFHADAQAAAHPTKVIGGIPAIEFYFIMGLLLLEMLVICFLGLLIRFLVHRISEPSEEVASLKKVKKIRISFWDRFNKVVPIEKEQDILLDHDYDGIRELDNSLPPWWKYGFYLTILVSFVYMWHYHAGGTGLSSEEEFHAAMRQAEEEKAAYLLLAANNVDENTVKMLGEIDIANGATLFTNNCAACHANDGGGGVGPNLTDPYWIHGGHIRDIFRVIKYGIPEKGMKSWKDDFSPNQIAQLSSYIITLQGKECANPKEPQGERYEAAEEAATESDEASDQPML